MSVSSELPIHPFSILSVPETLFNDVSTALGIGEEIEIPDESERAPRPYRGRLLDPSHPMTGFPGAIGFRVMYTGKGGEFQLWRRAPRATDVGMVFYPQSCLAIRANACDDGVWFSGQGTLMREKAWASLDYEGDLRSPAMVLAGMILLRATQLAQDPSCVSKRFWNNL